MNLKVGGKKERKQSNLLFALKLLPVFALAVGVGAGILLYEREKPLVSLTEKLTLVGKSQDLGLRVVDEKSGIRRLEVALVQNDNRVPLLVKDFPRQGYFFHAGPNHLEETVTIKPGAAGLIDGPVNLVISARDFSFWNWLAGNESVLETSFILDTRPPEVALVDSTRYLRPGGSGMVVYRVGEMTEHHGVMVNGFFHPGFPLPKRGEGFYGAIIGLPYDLVKFEDVYATATDRAGNEGRANFGMILRKADFRMDRRIDVPDAFLELKLPEFRNHYTEMTGDNLKQYVFVNSEVRKLNYQRILEVCRVSAPEAYWSGHFGRMARSSRQAGFGDHRVYYYHDQEVDRQVHLGIDLASVRHAEVDAANGGVVVFAEYLGIYGNTVIVDHGQGIFSLYSHLSQITVARDAVVKKGDVLGLTGSTGMAGGDHLHFSMLVNGIFVNPQEWWDQGWLDVNVLNHM